MSKYRVGLRWKNGEEEYIVVTSSLSSTELAEELKTKDKTRNLEVVYIKRLD